MNSMNFSIKYQNNNLFKSNLITMKSYFRFRWMFGVKWQKKFGKTLVQMG